MKKPSKLTESDINRIVNKVLNENELDENIIDSAKDMYQGLKGVWRGNGYDYFKYLSSLRGMARKLKKLDEPNKQIITQLNGLVSKISTSKMDPYKKQKVSDTINNAIRHFEAYSRYIDSIDNVITQKLD